MNLNSFGETGIIVMPSAEIKESGSINFSFSKNEIYKYGALTISPFKWLEASYFYYRPRDLYWYGPKTKGQFLDKGFSVKFNHKLSERLVLAIGLSDFSGTGYFTREYIVGTFVQDGYKVSTGIGFGKFADQDSFSNPFGAIASSLKTRPDASSNYKLGGSPAYDQWFRGNASLLFGAEFFLPGIFKNTSLKIDYDPFNYIDGFSSKGRRGADIDLRRKDSNINLGIHHSFKDNLSLGIYFIKGNTLNFTFSFGGNFSKPVFQKKLPDQSVVDTQKGRTPKESFYEDLILNINRKSVFMQTANLSDGNLKVAVASSKFRNPIHVHRVVGETVAKINKPDSVVIETLTTVGVNVGHELHHITTPLRDFTDTNNRILELVVKDTIMAAGKGDAYSSYEFRPTIKYPASFTGIAPALVNHIGDPVKFYYGGIVLRLDNEIQFSSRLQLNTEIHQNIANNFDEKRNYPDSLLPKVRTEIVSYLQESDSYISRMQLDYFFYPYRELFGKFSAGILENMYAGAGVEFLYKPFEQNFSFGLEAYRAIKRAFDRRFDLLKYEINTGHINFNYYLPQWGILGTLSYGKYLAGDEGYTFDISRRFSSGFRTGIFFTRTNVSAEQFGEGSFDKGFYFQIPIDLFLNDYRGGYINFKLRPLTRDGGQKLEAGNDLIGIMHTTSRAEIERDWGSFND
ncbi:MAG: YjbH domain-containing protein [Proteobacteria bacterium]|nr:YjbH domain-containing protein [Pseudomonadota bacterium]